MQRGKGELREENGIKVFSPSEILNKNDREKNVFSKFDNKGYKLYRNSIYKRKISDLWREFKVQIVSGVVAIGVVLAICFVANALQISLGYEVIIDGENIGVVTNENDVHIAVAEAQKDIKMFLGEDAVYEREPVLVRRIVSKKDIISPGEIKNALISKVDAMVECYALSVNDKVLFGVATEDAADWVLTRYKQKYVGETIADDMVVDFCEKVDVKKSYLHIGMLETPEEALDVLSGNTKQAATYTVKSNDTLWGIANKYGTTVEHLLAINNNLSENIREGMQINVEESIPLLSVKSTQTVSLIESVPYEVEKIDDNTIYKNTTVVAQKGKEGEAKVLARITKVNGVETHKDVLESETLVEPVKQIEKIGTKQRPATTGSGTFIRPSYGSLSSRFGSRWGRNHNGIDIAGAYNSDIKAADGGVVTYAGWMSGYGNYLVINHENGYQTAYGHCASLCVGVGKRVAKGDVIAKMGNTGRSTGTHLHFEVKKNGVYVNPLTYVSY